MRREKINIEELEKLPFGSFVIAKTPSDKEYKGIKFGKKVGFSDGSYVEIRDVLKWSFYALVPEGVSTKPENAVLVDQNDFLQKILDCISSDEVDKYLDNTSFKDIPQCKQAMVHGMLIAAMMTSKSTVGIDTNLSK